MRKGKRGSAGIDLSSLKEAMHDDRIWSAIGIVRAREGEGSHYEVDDGEVLVDVDFGDWVMPVWCPLGGTGGIETAGIWRIPSPGTLVVISVLNGHEADMPCIVATLSSGAVPDALDADTLVVVNTKKIKIISLEEDVEIEAGDGKKVLIGGGGHPLPKWDDFMADLNTFVTDLVASANPNVAEIVTAATTFQTAIGTALNYESNTVENG